MLLRAGEESVPEPSDRADIRRRYDEVVRAITSAEAEEHATRDGDPPGYVTFSAPVLVNVPPSTFVTVTLRSSWPWSTTR